MNTKRRKHKFDGESKQLFGKTPDGREAWAFNESADYVSIYIASRPGEESMSARIKKSKLKKLADLP